jgi:serine/threonine protein kinase
MLACLNVCVWICMFVVCGVVWCVVTPEVVATLQKESAIAGALQHPNIVRFYGLCVCPPTIFMVFELCSRGSLYSCLQARLRAMEAAAHAQRLKQQRLHLQQQQPAEAAAAGGEGTGLQQKLLSAAERTAAGSESAHAALAAAEEWDWSLVRIVRAALDVTRPIAYLHGLGYIHRYTHSSHISYPLSPQRLPTLVICVLMCFVVRCVM